MEVTQLLLTISNFLLPPGSSVEIRSETKHSRPDKSFELLSKTLLSRPGALPKPLPPPPPPPLFLQISSGMENQGKR
jgi:hypothetical protein